jgi:hypothetical protein
VRNGDPKVGLARVRQAEDALTSGGADPDWLDFYNPSRLACFASYAQVAAGKHAEAAATLERALAELTPLTTKQQAVVLFDLATAYAATDPQHAVDLAGQAVDTLKLDGYATAQERIPSVRAALRGTRFAGELDERTADTS